MSFGNPKIPGRACGNPPLSRFHLPRKCWAAVGDAKCPVHCGEPAEILRYWKASSARRTGPLGPATPARIVTGTAHRSPAAGMTSQNGDPAFVGLTPWQGALQKGAFQKPSSNHSGRALHPIRATDRMERKAEPLRPRDASGRILVAQTFRLSDRGGLNLLDFPPSLGWPIGNWPSNRFENLRICPRTGSRVDPGPRHARSVPRRLWK